MSDGRRHHGGGYSSGRCGIPWVVVTAVKVYLFSWTVLASALDTVVDQEGHDRQTNDPATHANPYGDTFAFMVIGVRCVTSGGGISLWQRRVSEEVGQPRFIGRTTVTTHEK